MSRALLLAMQRWSIVPTFGVTAQIPPIAKGAATRLRTHTRRRCDLDRALDRAADLRGRERDDLGGSGRARHDETDRAARLLLVRGHVVEDAIGEVPVEIDRQ